MTLGALLALCKSFSMQKSTVLCAIAAKRVKKQQTEKKIKKILVQKIGIPIMRLRWDDNVKHFTGWSEQRREKNPEIQG
ncbi:TPA: hypothetical protein JLU25_003614 [Escherichia coli]|nr:hypothetical protein [Escherichia coli]